MADIACRFETERLSLRPWRETDTGDRTDAEIAAIVAALLSERVTATLPSAWQGPYDHGRALAWMRAREGEASVSLAIRLQDRRPVGLLLLHALQGRSASRLDLMIGYMIAEDAWGRGLGRELVSGLVGWGRAEPSVTTLRAGSDAANIASIRVLERAGFEREDVRGADAAVSYRIDVR